VAPDRPSAEALRGHLDTYLARYKHPRQVAWLERLPSTAAGKLDRAEAARLAAPHLSPF
jgi:acyl-coenzyme A synthetase/AMP-(fatty) acid ligase